MFMKYFLLAVLVLLVMLAIARRQRLLSGWLATKRFLREVKVEMQKVTWPSKNDVIGWTVMVLTVVIVLTILISVWDQALSFVLGLVLPKGEGI